MIEHKRACVKADFEKSAVAEHAWLSGHYIDWDNVTKKMTCAEEK